MPSERRLGLVLLFIRLTIFLVMAVWTVDKFINPSHAAHVFDAYYGLGEVGHVLVLLVGGIESLILLAFVAGLFKTWTYATGSWSSSTVYRRWPLGPNTSTPLPALICCSSPPGRCGPRRLRCSYCATMTVTR